jgi:predicted nucleic acid-binding protein
MKPGWKPARESVPVADSFLLDTSAFMTLADKEPGFERVRDLLKAGKRGEIDLHASFVTLTEMRYILTYDRGAEKAARISGALRKFPVQWHHSDDALRDDAAKLKAAHKVSFADAFVAATAQRLNATLVHKDPEFDALAGAIKLLPLPPKATAT